MTADDRVRVRTLPNECGADLEVVIPFYEGLRLKPAGVALRSTGFEYLELAYPGQLSIPMVAWRCAEGEWNALVVARPTDAPAELALRNRADGRVEVRLKCFGQCTLRELHARGDWQHLAAAVAAIWRLSASNPRLSSRYDRFRFFVRQWVDSDAEAPLRTDWAAKPLEQSMLQQPERTIAFVYGIDPHEVDLEGRYFWSTGALSEAKALVRANPRLAQFRWLNLRTYKYAIPSLDIERSPPPRIRAAAKLYAQGVNDFSQYVFRSLEMCLGAEQWQKSRFEELKKLIGLGFKVIALDEFPAAPRWGTEACRATNHLHRPNDFADEWRVTLDLIRRISSYAREHDVLLSSEEPSAMLIPFTSGYLDGSFNDPPNMYEFWQRSDAAQRIPLFSTMFGDQLTPYTRIGGSPKPPEQWIVQEKMPGPR